MNVSVILLNLGGPDSLKTVRPFLFNLFSDKAIIDLPFFIRYPLAFLISSLRANKAKMIYSKMGGKSPLLHFTKAQANALSDALKNDRVNFSVHIAMRYFYPRASDVIKELKDAKPDLILLLPLYPQFSTTTTQSSFDEIKCLLQKTPAFQNIKIKEVKEYSDHPLFVKAHTELIKKALSNIKDKESVVILFSAHGIPLDCVTKKGDPYPLQIQKSVDSIMENFKGIPFSLCYQSKVGPKKWLGPYTDDEIIKYAKCNKTLVVVPIAFVSDHSETLVELDMDYKDLAFENGAMDYIRVDS